MKGINIIFPGQGSQSVGMGLNLYENHNEAKLVFEEVNDSLNFNLSKIIVEGPEDKLRLTENTQPALMATSIAIVKILEFELKKELSEFTDIVLGHSLGEYSALCKEDMMCVYSTRFTQSAGPGLETLFLRLWLPF